MALVNKLTAIGDAIRNKNGSTSKLTLDSMVTAINDMAEVTIDGVKFNGVLNLLKETGYSKELDVPYDCDTKPYVVVFNNGIHLMDSQGYKYHYRYNGSSWSKEADMLIPHISGCAAVLNGRIYVFAHSNAPAYKYYYESYNGSSWSAASNEIPYIVYNAGTVTLGDAIHMMGSSYASYYRFHYKFNGSTFTNVSTLPYDFYSGRAVVLNDEIHILGSAKSSSYYKHHYKYNGSSWVNVSTLPVGVGDVEVGCDVLDDEIHIIRGTSHYKWDGSSWTLVGSLPAEFYGRAVAFNKHLELFGQYDAAINSHYSIATKYKEA